jgi:hypothetical protein
MGLVKDEPGSTTERYLTSCDNEIELVSVRRQEGTGVEEEQNPVVITFPFRSIKSEHEVSLSVCLIK